ncbi:hypothetical protein I316_03017 [Kwoniella heveanensis BCC8398]|uniref:Uncharacterized protein n=1 Tax=Kwoniella heveanensis BCC8398 TaxID=1296120 RepID=A0A1B9GX03_9TREE|nr:hypothetical protein I316_03017 [Kwoniella heveanensis BCC8398]
MPPRSGRETRGSAREAAETPGSKRKRRPSTEALPKAVLPSASSLPQPASPNKLSVEINGTPDSKRQKISLKVKSDHQYWDEVPDALSKNIRESLVTVIAQMALDLPSPLNNILALWLPPDFTQKEENTLGYVLRQPDLTWDKLAYPNPVPARSQFHVPVPPLPSHLRPHGIYNFCASLYTLLTEIEPEQGVADSGIDVERWALTQKTPQTGEWFTSAVDVRETAKKGEAGSMASIAASGSNFGHASAITLQSGLVDASPKAPTLSESVIRRASLKMNRWKERRAPSRNGGFGSIPRGVTIPTVAPVIFTPSFGPSFDSTLTSGEQGYYSTLEGMHERARHREWAGRALRRSKLAEEGGYYGMLDAENDKGKIKETIDSLLANNNLMIAELHAWQDLRLRKGVSIVTERENQLAEELLGSLSRLTGNVRPTDIMLTASSSKRGSAHELARRFLPVHGPLIRGTLDPRRPHALHDNTTVRMKTPTNPPSLNGSTNPAASPHAPPPMKMPPPPIPSFVPPPPHTLPNNSSRYPTTTTNHRSSSSSTPTRQSYPYSSNQTDVNNHNNALYTRPVTAPVPSPNMALPGSSALYPRSAVPSSSSSSNLRQGFGQNPGSGAYTIGMRG